MNRNMLDSLTRQENATNTRRSGAQCMLFPFWRQLGRDAFCAHERIICVNFTVDDKTSRINHDFIGEVADLGEDVKCGCHDLLLFVGIRSAKNEVLPLISAQIRGFNTYEVASPFH